MRQYITDLINSMPPPVTAAIMSVILATLRVIYDREETKPMRVIMESLICGGLTLTAGAAISALGLNSSWTIFAGGVIGYIGATKVRDIALRFIDKKIDTSDDED